MATYDYEYGTSPRKLEPEIKAPKKTQKKVANSKKPNKAKTTKSKKDQAKLKETRLARTNFAIVMLVFLGSILILMYRNVKITESYSKVQSLSKEVSSLQKENGQIAVQIQNNLNLSNIEQTAISTLGMQKLSSRQTIYVNLDTKNYTEITRKSIIEESKPNLFQIIINKIVDFF